MKKKNKKTSGAKPKITGKAKVIAALMLLLITAEGWAREQIAVVLRHLDTANNRTEILLDKNGDGRPDLSITLNNENIDDLLLKDELAVGTTISYEDEGESGTQLPYIFPNALISIEGRNILEIFNDPTYFRHARRARTNEIIRGGR